MFTGIITHTGTIVASTLQGDLRLQIASGFAADDLVLGESIACGGCCLTVVDKGYLNDGQSFFSVDISAESLRCTAPGLWHVGSKLNLERAMRLGDRLGGHMVSGHVDGVATVVSVEVAGDSHTLTIAAPAELARFLAAKGSVTLDGVSLTVNAVDKNKFSVNIIPHTWQYTTLGERQMKDQLNLEVDLIARYVAQLLSRDTYATPCS